MTDAEHYREIAGATADYLGARCKQDVARLAHLTATIWHGKAVTTNGVRLVQRGELLKAKHTEAAPSNAKVSAVHRCFANFAVVRAENWEERQVALLLLFKQGDNWLVAGDATSDASAAEWDTRFNARRTEGAVLQVLEDYYRAVTDGDPDGVRRIFAPCWHMKNHENGALVSEDTDAFAKRLEECPLPTYWNDRQIADVQVIANRLAFVRVDKPSTPSTTVFLFARNETGWKIIDKAWTEGREG